MALKRQHLDFACLLELALPAAASPAQPDVACYYSAGNTPTEFSRVNLNNPQLNSAAEHVHNEIYASSESDDVPKQAFMPTPSLRARCAVLVAAAAVILLLKERAVFKLDHNIRQQSQ
eukprot:11107-Heterococcus_DN1.PRE.2